MSWIISCILSISGLFISFSSTSSISQVIEGNEINLNFNNSDFKIPFSYLEMNSEDKYTILPLKDFNLKTYVQKPDNLQINFIYTIIFLLLFAIIRFRANDLLVSWFILPFKRKRYEFILNEGITQNIFYYISSLILSFSIFSILVQYSLFKTFDYSDSLYIFCFLLAIHFYQLVIVSLTGWIFNQRNCSTEGVANIWAFNIITGLILSPFVISMFFINISAIPLLLKITWIIFFILYLIKILRLLQILFSYKVSIFYMILYLCVLEVIPLFILYKILV